MHTENHRILFRILYILKRYTDNWVDEQLKLSDKGFKVAYVPFLLSIAENGISNKLIAMQLQVSKMAVSKSIKELSLLGYIENVKDAKDGRSEVLTLSNKGEMMVKEIKALSEKLIAEYEKLIGKAQYDQMIDNLMIIQNYHEKVNR